MKSYKEMSVPELINEIARVKTLLATNHKPHTYQQNRKYLARLEKRYYELKN